MMQGDTRKSADTDAGTAADTAADTAAGNPGPVARHPLPLSATLA